MGTVLVVDDDRSVRWGLGERLRKRGHQVIEAATVPEALEQLDRVDVLLLDPQVQGCHLLGPGKPAGQPRLPHSIVFIPKPSARAGGPSERSPDLRRRIEEEAELEDVLDIVEEVLAGTSVA
jgi:hypothetical protein